MDYPCLSSSQANQIFLLRAFLFHSDDEHPSRDIHKGVHPRGFREDDTECRPTPGRRKRRHRRPRRAGSTLIRKSSSIEKGALHFPLTFCCRTLCWIGLLKSRTTTTKFNVILLLHCFVFFFK